MPNWCHNKLRVTGDAGAVERFREAVKTDEQPLSFERILPTPADLLEEGGIMPGWYIWRINHWGTKWDASFDEPFVALGAETADPDASPRGEAESTIDDSVLYQFDTAWSPPESIMIVLGRKYPDLTFTLEFGEPGMEFAGRITVVGDEMQRVELALSDVLGPEEMWF